MNVRTRTMIPLFDSRILRITHRFTGDGICSKLTWSKDNQDDEHNNGQETKQ